MEGANSAGAQSAEWAGATFAASPAHSVDFTAGKNLTQTQLAQVIGDADTVLPLDADTGEQLYVWSCWEEAPPSLRALEMDPWADAELRAEWLCAEGETPRKVGTPAEDVVEQAVGQKAQIRPGCPGRIARRLVARAAGEAHEVGEL